MMKRIVRGVASPSLFAGAALAQQPVQLTSEQMDKVTAGTLILETSNTSATVVSLFQRAYLTEPTSNLVLCPGCYLLINSRLSASLRNSGQRSARARYSRHKRAKLS
jgi:hypothetical protein